MNAEVKIEALPLVPHGTCENLRFRISQCLIVQSSLKYCHTQQETRVNM